MPDATIVIDDFPVLMVLEDFIADLEYIGLTNGKGCSCFLGGIGMCEENIMM